MSSPTSDDTRLEADQISTHSSYASSSDSSSRARRNKEKQALRLIAFIAANIIALACGSIVVFSLYAPLLQSRLHYTQFQVNAVAIAGSVALYLPISLIGYICDRVGLKPLALVGGILFGSGYGIAAGVYRKLDLEFRSHPGYRVNGDWSVPF
ncbi:putative transporter MCH1 [Fusarium oxysporum f. sp. rapae]|uniref:Putative transporter MCH1 n=1 Tax=Fusarium oxysporum f. sp. rapae TaxID=485398 RepID=A0A8J5U4L6_FUSOX|nr:putative transporter MCH1 [Fusarium oxysporum f. sp. rapae]